MPGLWTQATYNINIKIIQCAYNEKAYKNQTSEFKLNYTSEILHANKLIFTIRLGSDLTLSPGGGSGNNKNNNNNVLGPPVDKLGAVFPAITVFFRCLLR